MSLFSPHPAWDCGASIPPFQDHMCILHFYFFTLRIKELTSQSHCALCLCLCMKVSCCSLLNGASIQLKWWFPAVLKLATAEQDTQTDVRVISDLSFCTPPHSEELISFEKSAAEREQCGPRRRQSEKPESRKERERDEEGGVAKDQREMFGRTWTAMETANAAEGRRESGRRDGGVNPPCLSQQFKLISGALLLKSFISGGTFHRTDG